VSCAARQGLACWCSDDPDCVHKTPCLGDPARCSEKLYRNGNARVCSLPAGHTPGHKFNLVIGLRGELYALSDAELVELEEAIQ
jgi:hypothetical protein